MEISIEKTFQHVTWIIKDFFELPKNVGFFLDSPVFIFSGDSYCLRLYPNVKSMFGDETTFQVRRLSVFIPRKVSCKVGFRWRHWSGCECYDYKSVPLEKYDSYSRSWLQGDQDAYVPEGTFTVVCSLRLSEESRAGSFESNTAEVEQEREGFSGHYASFSSRMELSTDFPCTHVEWSVPEFFELVRETSDPLTSPEFSFAGDTYCLQFCPKEEGADTDLQLVRLTSNLPNRTVFFRVGYGWSGSYKYPDKSSLLVGKAGYCLSTSKLEAAEERDKYVPYGALSLVLFLRLAEQRSAGIGTSDAAQTQSRLTGMNKLQSDYRQLLQKGTESNTCVIVRGKEFQVHRVVLRARSTVFEAMFAHDTAEKESGRVVIDDLDPDSFGDFLEYLYIGDIQTGLSDDKVFELYAAADKYDVCTLKSKCVEHMRRTLSVGSFCDVLSLALRHHDGALLHQATSFFKDNLRSIIITAKWQQFALDNGTTANELFIKALVPEAQ